MKKRFLALFLALLLAPMWALGEDLLYEVDPETGEVLFLADPEEEIELESVAQDALDLVDGQMNILLLGIDARPGQESGRSDTMILLTVDANQKTVKLTSFMRDLYVEIPGYKNNRLNAAYRFGGPELLFETLKENFGIEVDQYVTVNFTMMADLVNQIGGLELYVEIPGYKNNRLNAAYRFGGPELLFETLKENFGIEVDQYVTVNFTMMADLVNQIGGLELDVESDYIRDRINAVIKMDNKALGIDIDTDLLSSSGVQTLNGKQVQAFARWRTGSSDFERTQRQREVIVAILEKLKNEFSLMQLMRLAATNFDNVYTNMSLATIMQLAPALFELDLSSIEQLRIPVDGAYKNQTVSGMAVLVPDRDKNIAAINEFFAES